MDEPRPVGRPKLYTEELAEKIISRMAEGESLLDICKDSDMPDRTTVWRWKLNNEQFCNDVLRAEEERAIVWADQALEIADDGSLDTKVTADGFEKEDREWTSRSKLRVETRLKLMAMFNTRRFRAAIAPIEEQRGESVRLEHPAKKPVGSEVDL